MDNKELQGRMKRLLRKAQEARRGFKADSHARNLIQPNDALDEVVYEAEFLTTELDIAESQRMMTKDSLLDRWPMEWIPIEQAPKDGTPLRLFDRALIDEDFNPSGSVEGYWQDDDGWVGAVWNPCQDLWDRKKINPTHFTRLPPRP